MLSPFSLSQINLGLDFVSSGAGQFSPNGVPDIAIRVTISPQTPAYLQQVIGATAYTLSGQGMWGTDSYCSPLAVVAQDEFGEWYSLNQFDGSVDLSISQFLLLIDPTDSAISSGFSTLIEVRLTLAEGFEWKGILPVSYGVPVPPSAPITDFTKQAIPLAEGLNLYSETDSRVIPFEWQDVTLEELTPLRVRSLVSAETAQVEVVPFDEFSYFKAVTNIYPGISPEEEESARRWQEFLSFLQRELSNLRVYRVGEIEIDIYAIGRLPKGTWAGFQSFVVET